jgi:hypothetical protein
LRGLTLKTIPQLLNYVIRLTEATLNEDNDAEKIEEYYKKLKIAEEELFERVGFSNVPSSEAEKLRERLIYLGVSEKSARGCAWVFGDGSWC